LASGALERAKCSLANASSSSAIFTSVAAVASLVRQSQIKRTTTLRPGRDEAEDAPHIVQVVRDTIFPVVRSATPRERTRRSYLTVVAVGLDPALVAAELSSFVIGVVDGF
jgi:hypothetical protein